MVALNILQSQKHVVDKKFVLDGFAKDGSANDAKPKPLRAAEVPSCSVFFQFKGLFCEMLLNYPAFL